MLWPVHIVADTVPYKLLLFMANPVGKLSYANWHNVPVDVYAGITQRAL